MVNSGKKLLVLDINGLLLDTYFQGEACPDRPHDAKVNRFYVYKRAFCEEFIQFALQNFIVGVWSSAREHNVLSLVDFMFKEAKEKLAFIWHQQHCTDTGFRHPDNKHKPVFLKELSKLWEKFEADLPWAKGDYGASNTLLIDDSPYKAISNPRHTAIFPKTYKATDPDDDFLAGELLPYLEGLLKERDVQRYIQRNPIGESGVSPSDPQWSQILKSDQFKSEEELAVPSHLMAIGASFRPNILVSSNQWTRPNSLLPANGGAAPQLVGAESQTWNAGQRDTWWNLSDRIPERNGDYHAGTYDSPRYMGDVYERGAGPSWRMSRDMSNDLIRKHAMLPRRSVDYGDSSTESDRPYNHFHHTSRESDRPYKRHRDMMSPLDYGGRASGWSEESEDFDEGEPWHFRRGGIRDQEGSHQGEGKRKRRVDWTRGSRNIPMDEHNVIRTRERSRGREEDPYTSSFERRSSPRDQEVSYQDEGRRKRRVDWTRDPRAAPMDEHHGIRTRERSRGREEETYTKGFERRSSPRHGYRREESQFKSKPRDGRDFQRISEKDFQRNAEKELPRKRDLPADTGGHYERYDQSYDGSLHKSRRKSGWKK